jgi:hypothetical protein
MGGAVVRVLGIDPTHRGLCFAVLEHPERLVDWGCLGAKALHPELVAHRMGILLDTYEPDFVAVPTLRLTSHGPKTRRAVHVVSHEALEYGAGIRQVSGRQVREMLRLPHGTRKYTVAVAIAARYPELARDLPPPRRPWESEPHHINLFDAAGFALGTLAEIVLPA